MQVRQPLHGHGVSALISSTRPPASKGPGGASKLGMAYRLICTTARECKAAPSGCGSRIMNVWFTNSGVRVRGAVSVRATESGRRAAPAAAADVASPWGGGKGGPEGPAIVIWT